MKGRNGVMKMTRYEQATIVNYNAGEHAATVNTTDKVVMRKLDALVADFPSIYKLIKQTDNDKTYFMPKSYISYRKPRELSNEQREQARQRIAKILNV